MRKYSFTILLVAVIMLLTSAFRSSDTFRSTDPIDLPAASSEDSVPELNQKVLEYVIANMNKKVGRGECWDLAAGALNEAGAEWDGEYEFGRLLDPGTDEIHPGDIVQFENVVTRDRTGNVAREERMLKHTAVIYRVLDKGVYDIAHQNTDKTGKKVGLSRFLLNSVLRGEVMIYRPS